MFPCGGEVVDWDLHYKYRVNTIIGQNKDQIALVFPHIGNEPFYCSIFAKLGDKKVDIIKSRGREREIVVGLRLIFVITWLRLETENLIIDSHLINTQLFQKIFSLKLRSVTQRGQRTETRNVRTHCARKGRVVSMQNQAGFLQTFFFDFYVQICA